MGCGAVIAEAAVHGLAPLSGSFPDVGVVGYTLGGGFSLLGRKYGLAADHVTAIEVVTALEFRLFPVTKLYGGSLQFGTESLPDVLRAWRDWTAGLPREMTSSRDAG